MHVESENVKNQSRYGAREKNTISFKQEKYISRVHSTHSLGHVYLVRN